MTVGAFHAGMCIGDKTFSLCHQHQLKHKNMTKLMTTFFIWVMFSCLVRMQPSRWLLSSRMKWLPAYLETQMTGVAGSSETFIHTYHIRQCHSPKYHKLYLNSKFFLMFIWEIAVSCKRIFFNWFPSAAIGKTDSLGSFQSSWLSMEINVCIQECNLPNKMEPKYEVPIVTAYCNWTMYLDNTQSFSVYPHLCCATAIEPATKCPTAIQQTLTLLPKKK